MTMIENERHHAKFPPEVATKFDWNHQEWKREPMTPCNKYMENRGHFHIAPPELPPKKTVSESIEIGLAHSSSISGETSSLEQHFPMNPFVLQPRKPIGSGKRDSPPMHNKRKSGFPIGNEQLLKHCSTQNQLSATTNTTSYRQWPKGATRMQSSFSFSLDNSSLKLHQVDTNCVNNRHNHFLGDRKQQRWTLCREDIKLSRKEGDTVERPVPQQANEPFFVHAPSRMTPPPHAAQIAEDSFFLIPPFSLKAEKQTVLKRSRHLRQRTCKP